VNLTSDNDLDPAEVHNLLGNQRRLLVIGYLSLFNPGATVEVRNVARVVRGVETGTPPNQVSTDDYESAYNGLIQTHLPKLADKDLIEYNERRKVVLVTRRLEQYALIVVLARFITSIGSMS
jgi:hypothetical protein